MGEQLHPSADSLGLPAPRSRRSFLRAATAGGAAILLPVVLDGCDDDDANVLGPPPGGGGEAPVPIDVGNDIGVLNFLYLLERLQTAFYDRVLAAPAAGLSAEALAVLQHLRGHDVAHREFLAARLGPQAIGALEFRFPDTDFQSAASVLETARRIEDLTIAGYNGAVPRLSDADLRLAASKVVSVEGRHAATLHDLLAAERGVAAPGVISAQGLGLLLPPDDVIEALDALLVTPVVITGI